MKTKTLLTVILTLFISLNFIVGQERTDYSTIFLDNLNDSWSVSSTYWMGHTYAFSNETSEDNSLLVVTSYSISETGHVHVIFEEFLNNDLPYEFQVSSCVYKKDLYGFLWHEYNKGYEIMYYVKKHDHDFEAHSIHINEHITQQMAALSFNDTIYMFFVDEADKFVKYYQIVYSDAHSKLVLVNDTPTVLNSNHKSIGNVAAITYVNDSLEEQIMLAYPGETDGRSNNKLNIYSGKPGNFELFAQKPSIPDYHIFQVSMAQGSVKGGFTQSYNIQFGYSIANSTHHGPVRCELNLKTAEFSDWESLDWPGDLYYHYTWFMEFYSKQTQKREKYLLQGYNYGSGNKGALWKSDMLTYQDQRSEVPPISHKSKYFDIVLVVEGAPPYALNGYELGDDIFNNSPLSTFEYTKDTEQSVSASTTYSQSVEANMGVGPVTAGFKASFMESSGTSNTESVSITNAIWPPPSQLDSNGVMWYYYVAPTVVRSRWAMQDYNGGNIEPTRNLFLFEFHSPQMKSMIFDLSDYGVNSPRADNLESYESRDVENMSGIQKILRNETDINIQAGGTGSLDLTFTDSHTDSHSETYDVSLGIDADYGIFSASASVSAGFEYSRERTTTCSNSFYIGWNLFSPKFPDDTTNVRKYTPISYVMKTTDSTAYFLLEGLKDYKPFFITYEITDIEHGDFLEFIGEDQELINKYSFSNYPNPFNGLTHFKYSLKSKSNVNLSIYNVHGQTVSMPINEVQTSGEHEYELSASDLSSGIYYYRLLIGEDLIMGKLIKN